MNKRPSGLGRGLGSLIPQKPTPDANSMPTPSASSAPSPDLNAAEAIVSVVNGEPLRVKLSDIAVNPEQPRVQFKEEELEELANSIREHGVLQPITVSPRPEGGYELVAGERRMRASKLAGLLEIPAFVRTPKDDQEKLVWALIENIQRSDLNPMEEARAYRRLSEEYDLTQEDVAKATGKARSTVANAVRLLDLEPEIQAAISTGQLPPTGARNLLRLPTGAARLAAFRKMMSANATVKQMEQELKPTQSHQKHADPVVTALEEELRQKYGTRVSVTKNGGKGQIVIGFYSDEEFNSIIDKLK